MCVLCLCVSVSFVCLFVCSGCYLLAHVYFHCFFPVQTTFSFYQKPKPTKTVRPETRKRDLARKPSCDLVFYLFTALPSPAYSPFQQLRATFWELCASFLVLRFWGLHARLDTDAATKDTDTSAWIPIVLLFLVRRGGAARCLHVACLFVSLCWEDARKRSGPWAATRSSLRSKLPSNNYTQSIKTTRGTPAQFWPRRVGSVDSRLRARALRDNCQLLRDRRSEHQC